MKNLMLLTLFTYYSVFALLASGAVCRPEESAAPTEKQQLNGGHKLLKELGSVSRRDSFHLDETPPKEADRGREVKNAAAEIAATISQAVTRSLLNESEAKLKRLPVTRKIIEKKKGRKQDAPMKDAEFAQKNQRLALLSPIERYIELQKMEAQDRHAVHDVTTRRKNTDKFSIGCISKEGGKNLVDHKRKQAEWVSPEQSAPFLHSLQYSYGRHGDKVPLGQHRVRASNFHQKNMDSTRKGFRVERPRYSSHELPAPGWPWSEPPSNIRNPAFEAFGQKRYHKNLLKEGLLKKSKPSAVSIQQQFSPEAGASFMYDKYRFNDMIQRYNSQIAKLGQTPLPMPFNNPYGNFAVKRSLEDDSQRVSDEIANVSVMEESKQVISPIEIGSEVDAERLHCETENSFDKDQTSSGQGFQNVRRLAVPGLEAMSTLMNVGQALLHGGGQTISDIVPIVVHNTRREDRGVLHLSGPKLEKIVESVPIVGPYVSKSQHYQKLINSRLFWRLFDPRFKKEKNADCFVPPRKGTYWNPEVSPINLLYNACYTPSSPNAPYLSNKPGLYRRPQDCKEGLKLERKCV